MGLFSRLATRPVYNTRAVVLRTGVPADTFRAWERRYGVPAPARSEGNQRLYSDRDIATISWLRDQTRSGVTISQAVELFKAREVSQEQEIGGPDPAAAAPTAMDEPAGANGRLARYTAALVNALVAYDAESATRLLDEAGALLSVEGLCLSIVQPALYEIGARWQRGDIPVSSEHFATSFAVRRLGSLFNASRPEHGAGPIVAACLEGELHEAGLLMTCLFLSRRGYRVIYLGPNLPTSDLIAALEEIRPPIVLLSASTPDGAAHLAQSSRGIKEACRALGDRAWAPQIGYGGRAFLDHPHLSNLVEGIFCGRDATQAVNVIDEYLAGCAHAVARE